MTRDLIARGQRDNRPTTVVIHRAGWGLQSLNPHPSPLLRLAALSDTWLQPGPLWGWWPCHKAT